MRVFPKHETINGGNYLSLYDRDGNLLARSAGSENPEQIIGIEFDGLIYMWFPQLPDNFFLDYSSVVKKFKG